MHQVNLMGAYSTMCVGHGSHDFFQQAAFLDLPLDQSAWKGMYHRAKRIFGAKIELVTKKTASPKHHRLQECSGGSICCWGRMVCAKGRQDPDGDGRRWVLGQALDRQT